MTSTIQTSFVQQFSSNLHHLLEQKGSKLMGLVNTVNVTGNKAFFERIGSLEVAEVTGRHADTVLQDENISRRMLIMKDYVGAIMMDHQDDIKTLISPVSAYAQKLANGMGRKMDDIIISALYGTAATGVDGSGSETFDTTNNQIASGSTGMTFEKLNQVKRMFMANEYDGPLVCVMHALALEDLLAETEIQSIDTNTVRALVRGDIDTFMGIKFVINNRIPLVGGEYNSLVFAPDAVKFGVGDNMSVSIDKRPDKNNNNQVLIRHSFGAVRMEQNLVVSVLHT